MPYELDNFAPVNAENAGGICSFEFLPKEYLVDDVMISINSNSCLAQPFTLQDWFVGKGAHQSTKFTEVMKQTSSGPLYEQKVRFTVNKDEVNINTLLTAMAYREFVVIYKDRNGNKKIIGNKTKAMVVTVELNIGAAFMDRNYFTVEMTHDSDRPAAFYPF